MATNENLFKDACPETSEVEEQIEDETDTNELETDITLKQLIKCQQEIESIIDMFGQNGYCLKQDDIKTVEDKYKDKLKDLFKKRNEAIDKIPRFWITVIKNNPKLPFRVNEYELDCLKHLTKFELDQLEDEANNRSGYKLSFSFYDNSYFKNDVLIKEFSRGLVGITSSTCTPISWNSDSESKCLQEQLRKSLCSGSSSFFEWLTDDDPSISVNFLQLFELWQNPLLYYTASEDCPGQDDNLLNNNTLLEDVKPYQEEINKLSSKFIYEQLARFTARIRESSDVLRNLIEQRNKLIREIPNFWATAISNHPDLSSMIGKEETECLRYLTHMEYDSYKDSECSEHFVFKIKMNFHFVENNPYISNSIITKEFGMKDGERSVQSTPIEWKNNKCLFSKKEEGDNCKNNSLNFFDWLNDDSCPKAIRHITLPVIELWGDPVNYYLNAAVNYGDGNNSQESNNM